MWDPLCGLQHTLWWTLHHTVSLRHPRHHPQVGLQNNKILTQTCIPILNHPHVHAQKNRSTKCSIKHFCFMKHCLLSVPSICSDESPVMFFPKRYTSHSSIQYHPGDKQLYAWDDGYQTIYKVETRRNDQVTAVE